MKTIRKYALKTVKKAETSEFILFRRYILNK
jgi:hypothetical protein